ncbi:RusA family crossover junction endodeoxyribonuclease [Schaalia sp. ZJ405]|uniref:RusA family crossover junction endodeoxyribonuclease n=1 Tax=Schaalia sp. ZJ405 TaxID=2709403 RepID=UPI0013EDFBDD|nr:RusA family crossover junction endodeoxyribonuclease [Schaalia sp. ZJ405]QPK80799.1 RusA family crossover junction endodeoxyribonuclease [Schaalia sp. ZJ405]
MSGQIQFFVPGVPVPEGSTKYVGKTRSGKPRITHDNPRLNGWRHKICDIAVLAAGKEGWSFPLDEPVIVIADFYLPRPKNPKFKDQAATKPDLDKLQRAVGDALACKGGVLAEDSRIIGWYSSKRWAKTTPSKPPNPFGEPSGPGVRVTVIRQGVVF